MHFANLLELELAEFLVADLNIVDAIDEIILILILELKQEAARRRSRECGRSDERLSLFPSCHSQTETLLQEQNISMPILLRIASLGNKPHRMARLAKQE